MSYVVSLTLDIVAIVLLASAVVIFLPGAVSQKNFSKIHNASVIILGMLVFDVTYLLLMQGKTGNAVIGAFFSKEIYLALNTLAVRAWCEYVGLLLWTGEKQRHGYALFCDLLTLVNLLLVIVNAYTNVMFRISSGFEFMLYPAGMLAFTAINYLMLMAALFAVLKNRAQLRKGVFKLLIIFPALCVLGELLAIIFRGCSFVVCYGISAILLIAIFKNYSGLKEIDRLIDKAIAEKLFYVCYQPIFTLSDGRCRSCEALLRLRDDEGNPLRPDEVVAAAENSGRIGDVFDCVLECVCCYLSSPGFATLGIERVHVNISTLQLSDPEFSKRFLKTVSDAGLPNSLLCVEVTESAASDDNDTLRRNLDELSEAGVSLSLDDYGSGYSNLSRILDLPFDSIKLDCSLIRGIGGEKANTIVETSLDMIRRMHLTAVAEGVETREQLDYLKRLGCTEIQGFYYSKPITATEFTDFITKLPENPDTEE